MTEHGGSPIATGFGKTLVSGSRLPTDIWAKTHHPQLLDDVERREIIVITRHGRAIARIVPEAHLRQAEVDTAIASIKTLRKRTGKITVEALVSAKHEGHKY
jgi:prevent-host-death family protein